MVSVVVPWLPWWRGPSPPRPCGAGQPPVQRSMPIIVLGVDLGLVGQQQFHHILLAIRGRSMQRCDAALILAENQIRIVLSSALTFSKSPLLAASSISPPEALLVGCRWSAGLKRGGDDNGTGLLF